VALLVVTSLQIFNCESILKIDQHLAELLARM